MTAGAPSKGKTLTVLAARNRPRANALDGMLLFLFCLNSIMAMAVSDGHYCRRLSWQ